MFITFSQNLWDNLLKDVDFGFTGGSKISHKNVLMLSHVKLQWKSYFKNYLRNFTK